MYMGYPSNCALLSLARPNKFFSPMHAATLVRSPHALERVLKTSGYGRFVLMVQLSGAGRARVAQTQVRIQPGAGGTLNLYLSSDLAYNQRPVPSPD